MFRDSAIRGASPVQIANLPRSRWWPGGNESVTQMLEKYYFLPTAAAVATCLRHAPRHWENPAYLCVWEVLRTQFKNFAFCFPLLGTRFVYLPEAGMVLALTLPLLTPVDAEGLPPGWRAKRARYAYAPIQIVWQSARWRSAPKLLQGLSRYPCFVCVLQEAFIKSAPHPRDYWDLPIGLANRC